MSSVLETLASYVPAVILDRLTVRPEPLRAPLAETRQGALLLADISDFTRLTRQHDGHRPAGAETLGRTLSGVFAELIQLVHAQGGDVLTFAGDAMLAFWPAEQEGQALATERAATCALSMQAALQHRRDLAQHAISLRIGLAAGPVNLLHVGGHGDRWEMLVSGDCLMALSQAKLAASPGDVVGTAEVWQTISDRFTGRILPDGNALLAAPSRALRWQACPPPRLHAGMQRALHQYLPPSVRERLLAGQTDWLADLRLVTAVFVNLPTLGTRTALDEAQGVMSQIQAILARFEGCIKELSTDDHGVVLVAMFGLPPLSHADDAARSIRAAMAIGDRLQADGVPHAIGIATGQAFCGVVGNERRRQFAIIGDVMVRAARLMPMAKQTIWCDQATAKAAGRHIHFSRLAPVALKGIDRPLPVFVPETLPMTEQHRPIALVGRQEERRTLLQHLEGVRIGRQGAMVLLEGEGGIGKTCLMAALAAEVEGRGVRCLHGAGDPYDQTTPYRAWQGIIASLLDLHPQRLRADDVEERLRRLTAVHPAWAPVVPLLATILGQPDPTDGAPLAGRLRSERLHDLLAAYLDREALKSPLLIVLDDAQWCDDASWLLIQHLCRTAPAVLIIVAARPAPGLAGLRQLRGQPQVRRLTLLRLPADDLHDVIAQRLGVYAVERPIVDVIQARAEGHPLFSEAIAAEFLSANLVAISDGECRLNAPLTHLVQQALPGTVAGIITSRIDRLPPSQQMIIKVAALLGGTFTVRQMQAICPLPTVAERADEHLDALVRHDLLTRTAGPEPTFAFRHSLVRDTVHGMLLHEQRQTLHLRVARWLESTGETGFHRQAVVLANHWDAAGHADQAIVYYDQAGQQALKQGASQTAIQCLGRAETLSDQTGSGSSRSARIDRATGLGLAHLQAGMLPAARLHLERSLALMGRPVPTSTGLGPATLGEILRQGWRLLRQPAPATSGIPMAALVIGEALRDTYLFSNDIGRYLHMCLWALNVAEGPNAGAVQTKALATAAVFADRLGLRRLADHYAAGAVAGMTADLDPAADLATRVLLASAWMSRGELVRGESLLEPALARDGFSDDRRQWGFAVALLAFAARARGNVARAKLEGQRLLQAGERYGDVHQQSIALVTIATSLYRQGDHAGSRACMTRAQESFDQSHDRLHSQTLTALEACLAAVDGDWDQARRLADDLLVQVRRAPSLVMSALGAYEQLADISLSIWEQAAPTSRPGRFGDAERARLATKALNHGARHLAVARPNALVQTGRYLWLSGKHAEAKQHWEGGLNAAVTMGLPGVEALANFELSRHLPEGDPTRVARLERAHSLLTDLGWRDTTPSPVRQPEDVAERRPD
jgi:class 3 adenylate cyclase/tetratricopeptide (TPR) repeat protein